MTFPLWLTKHLDTDIMPQRSRYTSKNLRHNHVALIFQRRKLLAIGHNRPFGSGHTHTVHAEVDAVRNLGDMNKLRGATLVVIHLGAATLLNSKPCASCECMLQKCQKTYGLRAWIYS